MSQDASAKFIEELGNATLVGSLPQETVMKLYRVACRLLAERDHLDECMKVAGLQCFMRGVKPEGVANHMDMVQRSWDGVMEERDRLLREDARRRAKASILYARLTRHEDIDFDELDRAIDLAVEEESNRVTILEVGNQAEGNMQPVQMLPEDAADPKKVCEAVRTQTTWDAYVTIDGDVQLVAPDPPTILGADGTPARKSSVEVTGISEDDGDRPKQASRVEGCPYLTRIDCDYLDATTGLYPCDDCPVVEEGEDD